MTGGPAKCLLQVAIRLDYSRRRLSAVPARYDAGEIESVLKDYFSMRDVTAGFTAGNSKNIREKRPGDLAMVISTLASHMMCTLMT